MDTHNLGAGAGTFFEMGQHGGGRLSGVGQSLKVLVDTLKEDKALRSDIEGQKEILGYKAKLEKENRSPLEDVVDLNKVLSLIETGDKLGLDMTGVIKGGKLSTQGIATEGQDITSLGSPQVAPITSEVNSNEAQWIPKERTKTLFGGYKYGKEERQPTQKEIDEAMTQKVKEQGALAAEKSARISEEKLGRFEPLKKTIQEKWLATSPYKAKGFSPTSLMVKIGGMPILGTWDVSKKWLQVTEAQRKDKAYTNFVGALRARIARSLGEDVGNLSEYEQSAVLSAVPTLFDTYETGMEKLTNLDDLVDEIKASRARDRGISLKGKTKTSNQIGRFTIEVE